jgi:hypothetical protein
MACNNVRIQYIGLQFCVCIKMIWIHKTGLKADKAFSLWQEHIGGHGPEANFHGGRVAISKGKFLTVFFTAR